MSTFDLDRNALPSFFRDAEVVGPAENDIPHFRALAAGLGAANGTNNCELTVARPSTLQLDKTGAAAYRGNDFGKIKELQSAAQKDLEAVYTNISTKKTAAWTKVRKDGKEFYMSWSTTGSIWAYTESTTTTTPPNSNNNNLVTPPAATGDPTPPSTTFQSVVQIGTYSRTTNILGIASYNLNTFAVITESVIALIVATAFGKLVAEGLLVPVVARFVVFLAQSAAEFGFESFAFAVPTAAISLVAATLVSTVVFIGLTFLWNWANRKYTIQLQVYNWDPTNTWVSTHQETDNAKICGDDNTTTKTYSISLPPMISPSSVVHPPGFDPIEVLDYVCYYATVVWDNDNTFLEGLDVAASFQKTNDSSTEGFTWAFTCPRFGNNKQVATDGVIDPKTYLSNPSWFTGDTAKKFEITTCSIPVSFALNSLSGADDNYYQI